jgi:glycosyltransferase involved in cell wall biosynthesis
LDKTIFIYGGNLGKPQGIQFLIKVLRSNSGNPEVFFVIVGDGTEYADLKKAIEKYQISNVLLHSAMGRDSYIELLKACDVGLIFLDPRFTIPNYPSRLLDYLSCKKPVLMAIDQATDIGRTAEENGYGLWVESRNVGDFNQKLKHFIDNPKRIRSMGEKGYQYLEKHYTVEQTYKRIMSHIKKDRVAA